MGKMYGEKPSIGVCGGAIWGTSRVVFVLVVEVLHHFTGITISQWVVV